MTIKYISSTLTDGDAVDPQGSDIITQTGSLDVGQPVPEGWRVLTGNQTRSRVARVVMRYELEVE